MPKLFQTITFILILYSCSPTEEALLAEARKFLDTQNPQKSLEYLERACAKNPQSFVAHNMKGAAHFAMNEYEEALKEWQIAVLLDSSSYKPYYNMGNALRELKSHLEAVSKYSQAISLRPNVKDIYINRGSTLYDLKNYEGALSDFKFAINLDSSDPKSQINTGKTLIRLFRLDEAKEYFIAAEKLDNSRGEIYFWMGYIAVNQGDQENGCRYLKRAKKLKFDQAESAVKSACDAS